MEHLTAYNEHLKRLQPLEEDHRRWTKFHAAVKKNQHRAVKRWLETDLDIMLYDAEAMKTAIDYNYVDIIKLMLDSGKLDNAWMQYVFDKIVLNGSPEAIDLALSYKTIEFSATNRALEYASLFRNSADTTRKLLEDGRFDPNVDDCKLLFKLVDNDRYEVTKTSIDIMKLFLADERTNLNHYSNAPIIRAASLGKLDALELLLATEQVDPAVDANAAIQYAARNGKADAVKMLMADERVDPSADKNAAINFAATRHHAIIVDMLLDDNRVLEIALAGDFRWTDDLIKTILIGKFDLDDELELRALFKMTR